MHSHESSVSVVRDWLGEGEDILGPDDLGVWLIGPRGCAVRLIAGDDRWYLSTRYQADDAYNLAEIGWAMAHDLALQEFIRRDR